MSNKAKKILFIVGISFFGLFLIYKLGDMFAPGSYPYAETYELNYPEEKVLAAIEEIKKENPALNGPPGLCDNDSTDQWHHVYFTVNNKIALTWTRSQGKKKTTLAFVSIMDHNWKRINHDFDFSENQEIKKKFEEIILKELEEKLNGNL